MNVNEKNGPVAEAERITREAALAEELDLDRMIAQASRLRKRVVVFVLLAAALLVGFNWPTPSS
jgi:hypothetical protein